MAKKAISQKLNNKNNEVSLLLDMMKFGGSNFSQLNDIKCTKFATEELEKIGCKTDFQIFGDTANVLATIGNGKKSICFCGHCDVVPSGMQKWSKNPCGEVVNISREKTQKNVNSKNTIRVYGRGAVDMLGGDACWISAVKEIVHEQPDILKKIQINTLLTGAEEGDGSNGTIKMVDYLKKKKKHFDACIVGEPTTELTKLEHIDTCKLKKVCCGRQGSFTFYLTIYGKSGHIAYKNIHDNPIKKAVKLCNELYKIKWNNETNLEIISFSANNQTDNVVLDKIDLVGNVRFYKISAIEVKKRILNSLNKILTAKEFTLKTNCCRIGYATKKSDKFLQLVLKEMKKYNPKAFTDMCFACTDAEYMTKISTSVCELGLVAKMMHQPDEYTTTDNLQDLKNIYKNIIVAFANQ